MKDNEKRFEEDIESHLINQEYRKLSMQGYDVSKGIYLDILVEFIKKTQSKSWERYEKYYGDEAPNKLYRRLEDSISHHGLLHVLRNGIKDMGIDLFICFFKPESELNPTLVERYEGNILGVTRQFAYSPFNNNTIDMVLSINGIPFIAIELKNQLKGQDYRNAMHQWRYNRDPKELIFRFNHRILVYFAVDLYETWMTTELKGADTHFLPFNQGSNGSGVSGGAGNPQNPYGYTTSYLWEDVLSKNSIIDILHRFISNPKDSKKIIFPRYHQYDVVKKVLSDVKDNGVGQKYLIEHSAGSGKSNSIAWIAYRLASVHDIDDKPIFDSVIIVTDRVVLDSQLQDTINGFEHRAGLVEAIDDKKRSRGLTEEINDKKRIIICTIQKFLFAYKDFDEMEGRKFAIIVDEAHQGQTGASAKTLRRALIDKKVAIKEYAEMEGIEEDEVDDTDELVAEVLAQGQHSNQSFFAFTATPKNKTIELFGRRNPSTGKHEPFHVYSMRQAIEEGFILDVLKYYTTLQDQFKIVRTTRDNPEVIEGQAKRVLVRYYKEHGFTIHKKTELIMDNFLNNGQFRIDGKAKAMVVADSRHNAVRYYHAIQEYIKDNPDITSNIGVLVAFSGEVKLDGKSYREAEMNIDSEGHYINSDKKLRKAFRSDKFNILVVANKYQTGFDEPLLHSMYVDKKLHGVNAVQTLSRMNRVYPGKVDTFVMDFVNTHEDMKKSFQPFFETTYLDGQTDYNRVYDLRTKIHSYMLYNDQDVDLFAKIKIDAAKKQDDKALGRVTSILKPVIDQYLELDEKQKYEYRDLLRKFNHAYSYITQIVRINDKELFKEFMFISYLINLLPKDTAEKISIDDKINLEFAKLKETYKGSIELEKTSVDLKPEQSVDAKRKPKSKDTLQSIIDKVNEQYMGQFTDSDKVIISGIFEMFMNDPEVKKYAQYAKENNPEMFIKSLFPDKFKDIALRLFTENHESFEKLFTDTSFYERVMDAMAKELYKKLRK
ncbi:type I restriction endonuclease subunit R [Acholeplasma laidlawii]|uniref:type I restriction endonuclease subunit R n=4 Tax=Acholeplasma laidlawii TaxID=2148 RepID=UPI0007D91B2A|nr:DEAD/DEAH box helicase family protein [Acholeplasma laidlawii]NWH12238.1 type I restriction endonuclease subunit R [Acholeplasma laidlawii]NWH13624.1 type I restriction endonuclease subunit R [Acholeplasma laidlawii]NWH14209.1 type I restriction endonuclease subunit R [Acholeplasma laidlawii]OAN20185.1 restriction endonuclease subunit R [Acholeplasma laidlawii]OED29259.1 restriction endonuclease subunit R [Acholeplasma laidlawii]